MTVHNSRTHTQPRRRIAAAALTRTLAIGALSGALAGVVIGGGLGRLTMRLLAATSPAARGGVTDAGAVVGRISLSGTLELAGFTTGAGLTAGLVYLVMRRALPVSASGRIGGFAVFAGVVVGAAFVGGSDSFDFTRLQPHWLAVTAFVLLPAAGGAATAALVEWAERARSRPSRVPTVALVAAALLASVAGRALAVVLPMAAVAYAVTLADPLRRVWERRWVTVAVRALVAALLVWGAYDLTSG